MGLHITKIIEQALIHTIINYDDVLTIRISDTTLFLHSNSTGSGNVITGSFHFVANRNEELSNLS